jgi:hypothetical protein
MVRLIVSVSLASQKRIFSSLCGVSLNNSDRTYQGKMKQAETVPMLVVVPLAPRLRRLSADVRALLAALPGAALLKCTRSRDDGDGGTDGTPPTESCMRLTGRGVRATIL